MSTIKPHSSNINAFGYVPAKSVLFVEFKGGTKYEYKKVPPEIFEQMKQCEEKGESVGSFLRRRVKGYFDCEKVSG